MTHELVIRGGTVVDGTGERGVLADVGIDGGRVTAVAPGLQGELTLDAADRIVAPGFIDIHTHYDAQVFWDPALTPSCFHGVTTVVAGNCGYTFAPTRPEHRDVMVQTLENVEDMDPDTLKAGLPWDFSTFPEYLASVERHGLSTNFACYIGHSAMRLFCMGLDAYERAANPEELEVMKEVLREGLLAGAAGFATSFVIAHHGAEGKPVPSRFADRAELEALLEVVGEVGLGVVDVSPGKRGEPCGIADLYDLQPKVGVPFTYAGILTSERGDHHKLIGMNDAGWERGAQVWPQVTPRPLTFGMTMFQPMTLYLIKDFAALAGAPLEQKRAAYSDPAWRESAAAAIEREQFAKPRWHTFEIAESSNTELIGRRLPAIAAERGSTPLDALLDLALDEPELQLRVRCVVGNDDPDGVDLLLSQDRCTLGLSDAGAHAGQLCDAPVPTDFLGRWVRDRGLMSIEKAVRKLTGLQADLFGFADRGYLRPGAWADVVVFDPATVDPGPLRRVKDLPAGGERLTADQPTGVDHVIVNGTPVQIDGHRVNEETRPGQVVRPSPR